MVNKIELPKLKHSKKYNMGRFTDEINAEVVYEHLFNNRTHRWLDRNILGDRKDSEGRDSMSILNFLGMKADYRGLFQNEKIEGVVQRLESEGDPYRETAQLLKLYDRTKNLESVVKQDIESEQAEEGGAEGGTKYSYGKRYERNPKNRKMAIEIHGLNCYACGFNFESVYGERGKSFIEVHHIRPLSTLQIETQIDPETDLIPLCSNCHRMVHRKKDEVLNVDVLKDFFDSKGKKE